MEIFINDKQIPFELEHEKNSLDIITAIEEFAQSTKPQQFITNIYINDQEFSFADEEGLKAMTIDQLQKIEISTSDIQGITILSINQIEKFLVILSSIFEDDSLDESFDRLADSMSWMKDGINQVVTIFGNGTDFLQKEHQQFTTWYDQLNTVIQDLSTETAEFNESTRSVCSQKTGQLSEALAQIKKKISTVFTEPDNTTILTNINDLIAEIDDIIPKLSNVPFLFQTGEDKESMAIVQDLTVLLENSIKIFSHFKDSFTMNMDRDTVKEVTFEEFFKTLTDHLKELMDSIENNDSVMIGDLLEYEFIPNLEEIRNLLDKLRTEAFTRAN